MEVDTTQTRYRLDDESPAPAAVAFVHKRLDATDLHAFIRSSPAKLIALGLLLVALCLLAGAVTATAVSSRQHSLDYLLNTAEPDANLAQSLYTSLSMTDAAAGTAFLSSGLEPTSVRDRYNQALGEASADLVAQSNSADDAPDSQLRTRIATGLPVYAGLVETARANNRDDHSVGAAYLSEASHLMRTTMLPAAAELQQHRSDAIIATQRHHVRPPWSAILLPPVALAALVAVQLYLARRWRRVFNLGLLLTSVTVVSLLTWTVLAGSISAVSTTEARDNGMVPATELTQSRIQVERARAAETLKLVRRQVGGDYDRNYDDATTKVAQLLNQYPRRATDFSDVSTARAALVRWREAHQRMNDALARGDFPGADAIAVGPDPTGAAVNVDTLDHALGNGIAETRNTLRAGIFDAARALDLLAPGALALSVLAAAFVVLGLWPRLREYR
ncbi:hypothetical protein ABIA39_005354 [Nocardia sp. GAS34]|uniref:hypothetical protein n=1 Tax=unclassified Nocardia TaxID=2637762 RepID=UPI003D1FDD47